jgi:hypothetical protein
MAFVLISLIRCEGTGERDEDTVFADGPKIR